MKYPSVFGVKNVKSLSRIWGQNNRIKIAEIAVAEAPNDDFRKNICSEDDFRSRIFGSFVVKFLAWLPLL